MFWPVSTGTQDGWARWLPGNGIVRLALGTVRVSTHNTVPGTPAGGAPFAMIGGTSAGTASGAVAAPED